MAVEKHILHKFNVARWSSTGNHAWNLPGNQNGITVEDHRATFQQLAASIWGQTDLRAGRLADVGRLQDLVELVAKRVHLVGAPLLTNVGDDVNRDQ